MWKGIHLLALALGLGLAFAPGAGAAVVSEPITAPGVGSEAQGAGMALTNLDGDPRPEMILMAYDNPSGANEFRYRVGFNLNPNGVAQSWSAIRKVDGAGFEGQGAGIAITNLDKDARPELIVVAYDDAPGTNTFRYRVGWNLRNTGTAGRWDSSYRTVAGVGWEGQGASVAVTNFDDDLRPDLVLMAYDDPSQGNSFRYRVGWNLGRNGAASRWESFHREIPGVGWEGQGAGIAIATLDKRRPALVAMAYDGANTFRYRVGWNVNENAYAPRWSDFVEVPGIGPVQGADVAFHDVNVNGFPELFLMGYHDKPGRNEFRYRVISDFAEDAVCCGNQPNGIYVEVDKLDTTAWPPLWAARNGQGYTLNGIFNRAGLKIVRGFSNSVPDLRNGMPYFDADLKAFFDANSDGAGAGYSDWWYVHEAVLTTSASNASGIMYDGADRRAYAVFTGAIATNARQLRTTAHELGHALCLKHNHGDAWRQRGVPFAVGRTIMNQGVALASTWNMGWSATSLHHFYDLPRTQWQPGNGLAWGACDSLND
jgi:hypothetical protein